MCGLLRSLPFVQFICARMWGHGVLPATLSPALSVYLRECVAAGSASALTACAICPTLRQSRSTTATRVLSTPVPISTPPTSLDQGLFFISLVSDPLAIRFSVSSGCARRRGVSTYAAILVLGCFCFLSFSFPVTGASVLLVSFWSGLCLIKRTWL